MQARKENTSEPVVDPADPSTWPVEQARALWFFRQANHDPTPVAIASHVPVDAFASANLRGLRLTFVDGTVLIRTVCGGPHERVSGKCRQAMDRYSTQHGGGLLEEGSNGVQINFAGNRREPDFQVRVIGRAAARGGPDCPSVVGEVIVTHPLPNMNNIKQIVTDYFRFGHVMKVILLIFFPHNDATNVDPMLYLEFEPHPHPLAAGHPYPHVRAVSFGTGPLPANAPTLDPAVPLVGAVGALAAHHIPCVLANADNPVFSVGIPAAVLYDGSAHPIADLPPCTLALYYLQRAYLGEAVQWPP